MRRIGVDNWILLLCVVGMLALTGCDISLQEAVQAGVFDFIAGTITDTLSALVPIADAAANAVQ